MLFLFYSNESPNIGFYPLLSDDSNKDIYQNSDETENRNNNITQHLIDLFIRSVYLILFYLYNSMKQ